jgi:hypothetical protein
VKTKSKSQAVFPSFFSSLPAVTSSTPHFQLLFPSCCAFFAPAWD